MAKTREFQKWVTLWAKDAVHEGVLQADDEWNDSSGASVALVQAEVLMVTSCCLMLQGSDVADGDWVTHKEWAAAITATSRSELVCLSKEAPRGSPERLYRYLRWKVMVVSPATEWETTFRLSLSMK